MENDPNRIQSGGAELIIHPDGSVYHLRLRPDEIAGIILLVGDQGRVERISRHFDRIEMKRQHREFLTHTGMLGNQRISVVSTGIGTDNIDIVMNELDALANINLTTGNAHPELRSLQLIRIGTSGALQKDIPVDSIVVSSHGLGLDSLMHYYDYQPPDETIYLAEQIKLQMHIPFLFPYVFAADQKLLQVFGECQKGITATGAGFYAPQGRTLRAPSRYPDLTAKLSAIQANGLRITNFEMETSAIYGLAALMGHRALSVNAIVANRLQNRFSQNPAHTIDQTIETVLAQLPQLR